jgi:uncharacterized protein YkwD
MTRTISTLLLAALLVLIAASPARAAGCAGADRVPTAATLGTARAATLCLLNAERKARGLRPLRENAKLTRASTGHSSDMVQRRYFDHTDPNGRGVMDRLRAVGYVGRHGRCLAGENIAWGPGSAGTPRAMVRMWMGSKYHRANILDGRYRAVGLGVAIGSPSEGAGDDAATYTTAFGAKLRARGARGR